MSALIAHLVSGEALFSGSVVAAGTLILKWYSPLSPYRRTLRMLHMSGWLLILLSSTPVAGWMWPTWLGLDLLAWRGRSIRSTVDGVESAHGQPCNRQPLRLAIVLLLMSTTAICVREGRFQIDSFRWRGAHAAIFVIGDSLSAGVDKSSTPWPQMLAGRGFPVTSLAQPGASTASALEQAQRIPKSATERLIIVEIGGNDLLSGRSAMEFEADLRGLLKSLRGPPGSVVMFELPLPPGYSGYGRVQRALADEWDVSLIPKRILTRVLIGPDQTIDGLHLSPTGHRQLADWFAQRL